MGELLRARIQYAESDATRWKDEFKTTSGRTDPWQFTTRIDNLGRALREFKTWLPIAGGALFLCALLKS
jgi:hypothetical protein